MAEKKRSGLSASRIMLYGILIKNPVLVQVIGLCPAVAAAADIYVSAILSVLVTGLLIVCECIASLMLKKVPRRIRIVFYFLIGLAVCSQTSYFLENNAPDLLNSVGVYLPLMAASSVVALRAEKFAVKKNLRLAFLDAVANGLGTSLVLLTSGLVRGLLGSGKIGELQVFASPPLRGLAMPFGGFIVLGFGAALLKWFISTFLRDADAQMQFGIRKKAKPQPAARPQPTAKPRAAAPAAAAPQTPAEPAAGTPAEPPEDSEENSLAGDFYERASEDAQDDLDDTLLYDPDALSVQEELDLILASIDTFEDILPTIKEDNDA